MIVDGDLLKLVIVESVWWGLIFKESTTFFFYQVVNNNGVNFITTNKFRATREFMEITTLVINHEVIKNQGNPRIWSRNKYKLTLAV